MRLPSYVPLVLCVFHKNACASPFSSDSKQSSEANLEVDAKTLFREPRARRADNWSPNFLNSVTETFAVDGSWLPNVSWDVGESYSGLLPISNQPNETRQLFFWFFPTSNQLKTKEIVIWLNGGPGCSSLQGLLTENGPLSWFPGTLSPVPNPYSWTNLTNVVWIDQPVGTGYSQGTPDISDETELAAQFVGFWEQFARTFCLEGWKVYLTGESYAGMYVSYIANAFLDVPASSPAKRYFDIAGIALNDAYIGDPNLQMSMTVPSFATYWNNVLNLNATFLSKLHANFTACGLASYYEEYFRFPPTSPAFPYVPYTGVESPGETCEMLITVAAAATEINPCFNWYHITDPCPWPYSVLGAADAEDYQPPGQFEYFTQPAVKSALHVPVDTVWSLCTPNIFVDKGQRTPLDPSVLPAQSHMFGRLIDEIGNVIIGNGDLDMLLTSNGTLLVLQNVTWGGMQGFQEYPSREFYVPYHSEYQPGAKTGSGTVGSWATERGLTFYRVQQGGHELPMYTPGATYRVIEYLLGRISGLDEVSDFTTQKDSFEI